MPQTAHSRFSPDAQTQRTEKAGTGGCCFSAFRQHAEYLHVTNLK